VQQNLESHSKVLDLGCGAGVIAEDLLNAGMEVVAMDLSAEMVTRTRDRLDVIARDRSDVLRGDCEKLPFRDNEFDAVVCLGVISFLQSNNAVIPEIRRILRDDGTLILAVRNRRALPRLLDVILFGRRMAGALLRTVKRISQGQWVAGKKEVPIPRLFNLPQLVKSLDRTGFFLLEKKHIGYGPFTVHGRELLSPSRSIGVSHTLDRLFQLPLLATFQVFSDVCVIVVKKQLMASTAPARPDQVNNDSISTQQA
jgi:SAM-dependent methyltransferase